MGKSSSQVVGYRYSAKFAAFIGNRIEKFLGINFDNRGWILHDPTKHPPNLLPVQKPNLYGETEGGVSGNIDIHFGTPDQEPNEVYQQYLPLVSGYPYQSYLLFRGITSVNQFTGAQTTAPGFYLGNSGYMKEMLLWVKRTRVRNDGREQWYKVRGDGAVVCEIGAKEYSAPEVARPQDIRITHYTSSSNTSHDIDYEYWDRYFYTLRENESAPLAAFAGGTSTSDTSQEYIGSFGNKWVFDNPVLKYVEIEATIAAESHNITIDGAEGYSIELISTKSPNSKVYKITCKTRNFLSVQVFLRGRVDNKVGGFYSGCFLVGVLFIAPPETDNTDNVEGTDINPIHKIREILTDDTAMGKPESDINNENFIKAADRIWNEGLGISWAVNEKSCIEAIEELCYHIEAGVRVNRQTGLYEVVLFRDDWFEEGEIHDIAENKIKDLSLEVMNSDDTVNQLNITYYDRERIKNSTFSVYENGSILTMGYANAESIEFPYFMNMRNAEIVANWKLKQFSTPAWAGSFTTGWREARKWNRYDLIRLPWSKKWEGTVLVRIVKINLGNGTDNTVTIDFEEVIPYSGEMNTSIVVDTPVDSGPQPPKPSINAVFEAPYYLTVLRAGQTNTDLELSNNPDIGYVAAIAAKPQSNSLNALLYTDGGAGDFDQVSRLDYCDILQLNQPIAETTSSFTVTGALTQVANSNNLILLNDEWMGFVSFDDETKVLTVKRGVLDSGMPKKHSSGYLFVFDLPDVAFDSTQYAHSEIIGAQVLTTTPSGIQELSESVQYVDIQSRAIRPYPPANVKINGDYFPDEIETDLIVTWVDRNRRQQTGGTPLSWFDNGVIIESNTQTHLIISQLDENQLELATSNANVTGVTSYTMPISVMQADTHLVRITLKTTRDGYECLNPFIHTVELSQFFSAPYDLTVEFKND